MRNITSALLVSLALLVTFVGAFSIPNKRSTRENHAARVEDSVSFTKQNVTSWGLERRFDEARFTFYDAGLGACGKTNSGGDFIVALNADQYEGGAHCFQSITITVGSKTTSAQIVDLCPGCPFGGLDFSRGLFDFFASESVGVLTGSWNFGGGGAAAPPAPPHTTTHTTPAAPKTTPHFNPPPTLTSPGTTSSHHAAAAASLTNAAAVSGSNDAARSASTTGSAAPAASDAVSSPPVDNLQQMGLVMVQLGSLIVAGGANGGGLS